MTRRLAAALAAALLLIARAVAHDGPPFPIVPTGVVGPYALSVWTDPDTTDDGTPGGQFWVMLGAAREGVALPPDTRAVVTIRPLQRSGAALTARAEPVGGDVGRQFAALVMDHEGRFAVHVVVHGGLGSASVDAEVDATYDLRPPPALLALYVLPFLAVGALWLKLLVRRRRQGIRR
jgi:hypothetical protein